MPFAINVKAAGTTRTRIEVLWTEFSQFEDAPSMVTLNYPPHITLAVYENISEDALCNALHAELSALPPFRLTFTRLAFFERPKLVFWAAPERSEALFAAHAAIHRRIDPTLCHPHYKPDVWTPHCTLAMNIVPANTLKAIARAKQRIDPFDVVFDQADCVEFRPVRIIDDCTLASRPCGR